MTALGARRSRGDGDAAPTYLIGPRAIDDGQQPRIVVARDQHGQVLGVDLVIPWDGVRHASGLVLRFADLTSAADAADLLEEIAVELEERPVAAASRPTGPALVAAAARKAAGQ